MSRALLSSPNSAANLKALKMPKSREVMGQSEAGSDTRVWARLVYNIYGDLRSLFVSAGMIAP